MRKALIVDDSRAMRLVLRQLLSALDFEVVEAKNGREGLTYLTANPDITVALVDWNMPEMNGLELVEAVRRDPRLHGVPLMMVTTETELAHVTRALEAGANEYVMKPFTADAIRDKLALLGAIETGCNV